MSDAVIYSSKTLIHNMRALGVIDQIAQAVSKKHRLPLIAGCIIGGFIPAASFTLIHCETEKEPLMWLLVVAALAYSALTVFDWAKIAFKHPIKAIGFVVLIEGVMTFSKTVWLSFAALALLIAINGIATGVNLIADRKLRKKEAKRG